MRNFIRRTAAALAVLCMAALLLGTPTEAEERTYSAGGEAVGYYAGWAAYQGFTPDQIPAEHLTQINYAFAQIDPDTLTIALENPAHDQKNLAALRKLRQQNQHLKLLISVGRWSDSQYFSDAVATAARRESFAASCVDFVVEQGLDGVDLDWEYPVSGGAAGTIHRPADKQNFTLLLQELREQLGCEAVIHMDPIVTNDGITEETRERVAALIHCIDDDINIHDFRMVTGPTHTNLIFDAVVPFKFRLSDEEVERKIKTAVRTLDGNYYAVVNVEKSYT